MLEASHCDRRAGRFRPGACRAANFTDLEPHEAPDGNVFTQLDDRLADHFADRHALVLDVVLLVQAVLFVEFFHLAAHDLFNDWFWFARGSRLSAVNLALLVEHIRRHFLAPHVSRVERGDVHRDVVTEALERFRARYEVRLAVDLHQHADLSAGVDVTADEAFAGFALRLLRRGRLALLAQDADGFLDVAAGFHQRCPAIGEARVRPLAQLLHELRWDLNCFRFCAHAPSLPATL